MSANNGKPVHCATYIHSNFDGGGAADRNAVALQRQAIQAYIARERKKGVVCVPENYEDIGQPGGAFKRPGMQKLLADAAAGRLNRFVSVNTSSVIPSLREAKNIWKILRNHRVDHTEVDLLHPIVAGLERECWVWGLHCAEHELFWRREHRPHKMIRCAAYLRGSYAAPGVDNLERQRRKITEHFTDWQLRHALCLPAEYVDLESSRSTSDQPGLRRLVEDADAGRVDCVIVDTFDRLTERVISHEAFLAKLRQRDVTLRTVRPLFYHVWGKRMEKAWLGEQYAFLKYLCRRHAPRATMPRQPRPDWERYKAQKLTETFEFYKTILRLE